MTHGAYYFWVISQQNKLEKITGVFTFTVFLFTHLNRPSKTFSKIDTAILAYGFTPIASKTPSISEACSKFCTTGPSHKAVLEGLKYHVVSRLRRKYDSLGARDLRCIIPEIITSQMKLTPNARVTTTHVIHTAGG